MNIWPTKKINLLAVHIKLGIVKQVVKVMDANKPAFTYLIKKNSRLSEAKIKKGIFGGSRITDVFKNPKFGKPVRL